MVRRGVSPCNWDGGLDELVDVGGLEPSTGQLRRLLSLLVPMFLGSRSYRHVGQV